jgi:hypothetical protein
MMRAPPPLARKLLDSVSGVRSCGEGWEAICPAHDDRRASLTVGVGQHGGILVHCHAGCEPEAILAAVGLTMRDLYPPREEAERNGRARRIEATYDYQDESRELLSQSVRFSPKGFSQRRPDGRGGWIPNLKGVRRVPYRLPELRAAPAGATVYIPEGEKDVEALERLGLVATCNAGGAGKWRDDFAEFLRGRPAVVLPDNDDPGRRHAEQVAQSLSGIAASVRVLPLPGLAEHGDVSDWLKGGGSREELARLAGQTPEWEPSAGDREEQAARETDRLPLVRLTRLSEVEAEAVTWLWQERIPQAKLSLIDGDPEEGKSLVTLDLAARVSTGAAMPDRSACGLPDAADVVLLGIEDGLADTVVPRLMAAGADRQRIHSIDGVPERRATGEIVRLATLADLGSLEAAIRQTGAKLLVVDPLTAFLPAGVDSHNDAEVRAVLAPLAALAERTGCAVLVVRHLNKQPGGNPLYRGGGSIAIIGVARAAMLAAPDPTDPEKLRRVLAVSKSNLARKPPSLAYRIEDNGDGVARIEWLGETAQSAADLLAPVRQPSPERQELLDLVEEVGEPVDAPTLAKRLDWPGERVRYHLAEAVKAGQLRRVATGMYAPPDRSQLESEPSSSRPSQPHNAHNAHNSAADLPPTHLTTCEGCEDCEPVRGVRDESPPLFVPGPAADLAGQAPRRPAMMEGY